MKRRKPPAPAVAATTAPAPAAPANRLAWKAVLLIAGAVLWRWVDQNFRRPSLATALPVIVAIAIAAIVLLVPGVRRAIDVRLDRLRQPDPRSRRLIAVAIAAGSAFALFVVAYVRGRDLFPRMHDEYSYLLGARMLAHGRLWMPSHPLADFFDSFHILVRPVYASIYFPGTALLNVPAIWAGVPSWVTPALLSGAIIGMTYRVVAEVLDGVAGLLAALAVLAVAAFRVWSTLVLAQGPAALLGLAMIWAWLRWRRDKRLRWVAVLGAAAGWGAITRPVDALSFALPVTLAMAWDLRRDGRRAWLMTVAVLVVAASPFLALQLAFNLGVTGRPLLTPYVMYLQHDQPGTTFGSTADPSVAPAEARPASVLPQKQIYYDSLMAQEGFVRSKGAASWLAGRATLLLWTVLPASAMLVLLPVALLRFKNLPLAVCCAVPVLFFVLYTPNPFFLAHYTLPLVPLMACWVVAGAAALEGSGQRGPGAVATLSLAAVCVGLLPLVNPRVNDEDAYRTPMLEAVESSLAKIDPPAVVLFRFSPKSTVHEEPVYNIGTTWPDDAPIIRAHDLGDRNVEIARYYAERQPQRRFYLFDRGGTDEEHLVTPLGTAGEYLKSLEQQPPTR